MKSTVFTSILTFLVVIIFSTMCRASEPGASAKIAELELRPQKGISVPDIEKGKIKDSFKYYVLSDSEIPIVRGVVYIRGGSVYEPVEKTGLTSLMTVLQRSGGTTKLSPIQLDEKLDRMASSISISAGNEYIAARFSCTRENFAETFDIFLDILFEPAFNEERFDLLKKQAINNVKRRADSPETLASTGYAALIFGRDNPWGEYATTETIESITIEDIKKQYGRFYDPDKMILGVAGDTSLKEVLQFVKNYKGYHKETPVEIVLPEGKGKEEEGLFIVDKDINQTVINMGHLGSTRNNPDKYALIVMNDMLGGTAFTAVLPSIIRVEMGLAYTVGSSYGFGPDESPGLFKVYLTTKTVSAIKAWATIREILSKYSDGEWINEERLNRSKNSILRRLVFEYSSAIGIINQMVNFSYLGYPDNYVEIYGEEIARISLNDIKRVAKEYLHPDKMLTVMVGDRMELKKDLTNNIKYADLIIQE